MPNYNVIASYNFEYEIEADNQEHANNIALYKSYQDISADFYTEMSCDVTELPN